MVLYVSYESDTRKISPRSYLGSIIFYRAVNVFIYDLYYHIMGLENCHKENITTCMVRNVTMYCKNELYYYRYHRGATEHIDCIYAMVLDSIPSLGK